MTFKQTYMKLMERYDNIPSVFKKPTDEDRKIRTAEKIAKMNIAELAYDEYYDELKKRIDAGADVNASDSDGYTALMYASTYNRTDIVKMLIDAGADVNMKDKGNDTALIMSCLYGYTDIVQLLIDKGADVNAKNKYDYTPLIYASGNGYTDIVKLLKQHGAK